MLNVNLNLKILNKNKIYKLIKNRDLAIFNNKTRDNKHLRSFIDQHSNILVKKEFTDTLYSISSK